VDKNSFLLPKWRRRLLKHHLLTSLIALELALSVIFLLVGYLIGNMYVRGVGVGLVIAWVTSLVAYLFQRQLVNA
jgi:prepilin signal peptidase PulO-like enzyme (type II secretory pathway)